MCIFFFNNKVKLTSLEDVMSTSVNKGVKLDTTITIPENFIGLFYYSDKYLFSLPTGEYKFQIDTFNKVIKSNHKKFKQNEKPNYDFLIHYINLSRQKLDLEFTTTSNFKQKISYHLSCIYEISNPQAFASEMLITWYKTTNKRTLKILRSWFKDFAVSSFRKKIKQNQDINSQIHENANKYFKHYGINICDIKITKSGENVTLEENIDRVPTNIENQNNNYNINQNIKEEHFCPNCQSKVYENADYCHVCGYKFLNKFVSNSTRTIDIRKD